MKNQRFCVIFSILLGLIGTAIAAAANNRGGEYILLYSFILWDESKQFKKMFFKLKKNLYKNIINMN